jgi:integrase
MSLADDIEQLRKQPNKWLTTSLNHGHGSLAFRGLSKGNISVYYRYSDAGKQQSPMKIGMYDRKGVDGLTLKECRVKAGELSMNHAGGITALKEHVEAKAESHNNNLRKATTGTFGQLLNSYQASLESENRSSAKQVAALFNKWVKQPYPELLSKRANQITQKHIMDILRSAVATGVERTVNKLRSYLLAAFNRAMRAESDPSLAVIIGTGYSLEINPVMATTRVARFEKARERVLTNEELAHYLNEIEKNESVQSIALRLGIRLGGQRVEQLVRIPPQAVDMASNQITLLDPKGRRQAPRKHILPIPEQVKPLLEKLLELNKDKKYLFCNVKEDSHTSASELSSVVKKISQGTYCLGDIRRTAETNLAALGVSKDHRAQLQSHGISGVQDRHYDKHGYMVEKRHALKCWNDHLNRLLDPYL